MVELADPRPEDDCVDLGAGSGFITLPFASATRSMLAVDVSPQMLEALSLKAQEARLTNLQTQVCDIARLTLPTASVDIVLSNYALHSVPHKAKQRLLRQVHDWLRPGGRLVVGDMMMGRGFDARDRSILADKSRRLLRQGPAGAWRLMRNAAQLGIGVGENRPAPPDWWVRALAEAGFVDVHFVDVVAEAGVVAGTRLSR